MRKRLLSVLAAMALLAGGLMLYISPAAAATVEDVVGFADTDPLRLRYNRPATIWAYGNSPSNTAYNNNYDALPLGNGFIGAMVFGGVDSDRIQINEHTLWSGGPGANASYNGGFNGTSANAKSAMISLRNSLQTKMTNFTANNYARPQAETGPSGSQTIGGIRAWNYPNETTEERGWITSLQGGKTNFGAYQTFGNLLISDATKLAPKVIYGSAGNADPSGGEQAINLFDGSTGTKWYSSRAASVANPVVISWGYDQELNFKDYALVTGNDMSARDPVAWTLHGSNDEGTTKTWTLLDTQTNGALPDGRHTSKTFTRAAGASFKHFEMRITSIKGSDRPQLCQINLIQVGGATPTPIPADYTRTLDLRTAIHTTKYTVGAGADAVTYTRESFISNPGNVMVVRLTASQPGSITRRIHFTSEQTAKTVTAAGDTISITGSPSDHSQTNRLHFAGSIKVLNTGGTRTAVGGDSIDVEGADEVLILFSCGTNYNQCMDNTFNYFKTGGAAPVAAAAKARVEQAAEQTYVELLKGHVDDYQELFGRVELDLTGATMPNMTTDTLLARYGALNSSGYSGNFNNATAAERRYLERLYYQFGRYLLISSSRPGGLPANLQGIWAEGLSPPWAADYHTNINVQMNYWPAQQTNLAECHQPYIQYTNSLVPRGKLNANYYFPKGDNTLGTIRGWSIGHENNIWGNTAHGNWYEGFFCPEAAGWMALDIWEYYAFTQDKAFLAANFQTL
ncbi:MAG: glycoside hydrolase family 95 protein, partial [Oscillospiraceae bacterium]|nr:glycoside hydrolase family 95 protein [Oscillospiraceae bacterium]